MKNTLLNLQNTKSQTSAPKREGNHSKTEILNLKNIKSPKKAP